MNPIKLVMQINMIVMASTMYSAMLLRRRSHILPAKGRENMIKTAVAAICCTVLIAALAVVALDAWQYEYFGDCNGCIVLDTLRPGLDR